MSEVLIATIVGAVGLVGIVHALFPARATLGADIARSQGTSRRLSRPKLTQGYDAWRVHLGATVVRTIEGRSELMSRLAPDIAIANVTAEEIAFSALVGGIGGLAIGPLTAVAMAAAGIALPFAFPAIVSIALGLGGASLALFEVRSKAAKAREHFVAVTASYLEWVSLCQAGGMGIEESLVSSARVSNDWALIAIRSELAEGSLRSRTPWDSLGMLGNRFGISDLLRLRRAVRLAGTEGARVRDSIASLATSIREREMEAARRRANAVSRRVFLANIILMTAFIALVTFPGIVGHF